MAGIVQYGTVCSSSAAHSTSATVRHAAGRHVCVYEWMRYVLWPSAPAWHPHSPGSFTRRLAPHDQLPAGVSRPLTLLFACIYPSLCHHRSTLACCNSHGPGSFMSEKPLMSVCNWVEDFFPADKSIKYDGTTTEKVGIFTVTW